MAVSYATTGPSIATGEIKWSTLRRSFKTVILREDFAGSEDFTADNDTISISASELLRDTDTTKSEDPIVGDATENAAVATSSDWAASQMRNTIKACFAGQTGTDDNQSDASVVGLNIVTMLDPQPWRSNLSKTIIKRLYINGTVGSVASDQAALSCNTATLRNLTIDVVGNIEAAGGSPNGGAGGSAIDLSVTTSSRVVVNVRTGSYISAGGGAGGRGGYGTYSYTSSYQCTYGSTCATGAGPCRRGSEPCFNDGGARSCRCHGQKPAGWDGGVVGCADYPPSAGCGSGCTCRRCVASCNQTNSGTGPGGTGGVGAGYVAQTAQPGGSPPNISGSTVSGGNGGNGGERGVRGSDGAAGNSSPGPTAGGDPGRAIGPAGGSWTVTGNPVPGTTVLGLYIPQYIHCFIMKLDPKSQESKDLVWKLFKRGNDFSQWLYLLDDDEFNERMDICNKCPSKNTRYNSCDECGCDLQHKLGWCLETCPLGKWGETRKSFDKKVEHVLTYLDQNPSQPGNDRPYFPPEAAVGEWFEWNFWKFTKQPNGTWDVEDVDIENQTCYHSM